MKATIMNTRGFEITVRELKRQEIHNVWSIDRTECVDNIYYCENGELILKSEHFDIKGWSQGEQEQYSPILLDCFDRGGTFYGAFDGKKLIGAAILESQFIGREKDQLQLKFLHVSRDYRNAGLGRTLFEKAVSRAMQLGARRLYISSTPSENTVNFYLHLGCCVTNHVDPVLFELEPWDIHFEFDIQAREDS